MEHGGSYIGMVSVTEISATSVSQSESFCVSLQVFSMTLLSVSPSLCLSVLSHTDTSIRLWDFRSLTLSIHHVSQRSCH